MQWKMTDVPMKLNYMTLMGFRSRLFHVNATMRSAKISVREYLPVLRRDIPTFFLQPKIS